MKCMKKSAKRALATHLKRGLKWLKSLTIRVLTLLMFPLPLTIPLTIGLNQPPLNAVGENILPKRLKRLLIFPLWRQILSVLPSRLKSSSKTVFRISFLSADLILPIRIGQKRCSRAEKMKSKGVYAAYTALKV